jgi:hypothetical protein
MTHGDRSPSNSFQSSHLTRGEFIRLGGLATALLWAPGSILRMAEAGAPGVAAFDILNDRFPIGIFTPPPAAETTQTRYQQIANAGFTFIIGGNGVMNLMTIPAALDVSAGAGLDYIATDGVLQNRIGTGVGNIPNRIRDIVNAIGNHSALAGLNVFDEPDSSQFERVALARQTLSQLAPRLLPYVNAHASYAGPTEWGTPTYEEYISDLIDVVRPPVLSFDHYPLLAGGAVTEDYFFNWSVIARQRALHSGFPLRTWAFIQSVDFTSVNGDRRRPTETEILWQVNVSLAYGARGIMYFTYWTPPGAAFGRALVTREGELTDLYDAATRVNEYLGSVGNILLDLTPQSTTHANEDPLPLGAQPFVPNDFVAATGGDPVILGLSRGPLATHRFLLVSNRFFDRAAVADLQFTNTVHSVFLFDPATGAFNQVKLSDPRNVRVDLAPGAARLYRLRTRLA